MRRLNVTVPARSSARSSVAKWFVGAALLLALAASDAPRVSAQASLQGQWTTLPYLMLRTGQPELGVRLAGFISVYWPQCFGPLPQRVCGNELHLADLVAAERKRDRVVALHQQARSAATRSAAKYRAKPCELFDGGGTGAERNGWQRSERAEHAGSV